MECFFELQKILEKIPSDKQEYVRGYLLGYAQRILDENREQPDISAKPNDLSKFL